MSSPHQTMFRPPLAFLRRVFLPFSFAAVACLLASCEIDSLPPAPLATSTENALARELEPASGAAPTGQPWPASPPPPIQTRRSTPTPIAITQETPTPEPTSISNLKPTPTPIPRSASSPLLEPMPTSTPEFTPTATPERSPALPLGDTQASTEVSVQCPSPEVTDRIGTLPWVASTSSEAADSEVISGLCLAAMDMPESFDALMGSQWIRQTGEGVGIAVSAVVDRASGLSSRTKNAFFEVLRSPLLSEASTADVAWFATDREGLWVELTHRLPWHVLTQGRLWQLLWYSPVRDTVTDRQLAAVALLHMAHEDLDLARAIGAFPWFQNGLDYSDQSTMFGLWNLFSQSAEVFSAVADQQWLQVDHLGPDVAAIVTDLDIINRQSYGPRHEETLLSLLEMPFLEDTEQLDALALKSLALIAQESEGQYLHEILSHPTLRRGITALEEFMGVPYPVPYTFILVADATSNLGGGGGRGFVTIDPGHEEDRPLIVHEAAHTYWNQFPRWIAEGGASFMEVMLEKVEFGPERCELVDNLSQFDAYWLEQTRSIQESEPIDTASCEYILGRGLLLDLYTNLGDEAFRESFRKLWLAFQRRDYDDACWDETEISWNDAAMERGICYVRNAFVAEAPANSAATAEPIIEKWYNGTPQ